MQGTLESKRHALALSVLAAALGLLVVFVLFCRREPSVPSPDDAVLASVEERTITVGTFKQAMQARAGALPGMFDTREDKQKLLQELVRHEMLIGKARKEGYFEDPAIVRALNRMAVDRLVEATLQEAGKAPITDEDVAQYYKQNTAQFRTPDRARVAWILIRIPRRISAAKREELRAKAQRIREEAESIAGNDTDFGPLAARHSQDQASRYWGGEIGWVTRGQDHARWSAEVSETIFRLDRPGALSPVVETGEGFAVFRVMERAQARDVPLSDVTERIRRTIAKQRKDHALEALYAACRKELRVKTHDKMLDSIEAPSVRAPRPEQTRPPLPALN